MSLEDIEKQLKNLREKQYEESKIKLPRKKRILEKKAGKKADSVPVEYLTQKNTVRRLLCKVVSGDLIVVDNKVHRLNPRDLWRDGKTLWYKIREIDRLPISNRDYDKLINQKRITVNDSVVIKAILGAVQKKESPLANKKWIIWLIILGVVAVVGYMIFFAK
jgi:hypothetical protein